MSAPSLTHRLLGAVLLACALAWLFFAASDFYLRDAAMTANRQVMMANDSYLLSRFDSQREVAAFMRSQSAMMNPAYIGPRRIFEVWQVNGERVYFDPAERFLIKPSEIAENAVRVVQIDGHSYQIFRHDSAQWILLMAAPVYTFADYLYSKGDEVKVQVAICAPFFLLFVVWVVRRGMAPLQELIKHLNHGQAQDQHALQFDAKYAEFKPLVLALDALLQRLHLKIAHEQAFMQDAAHEMRTPLAVIAAQLPLLRQAGTACELAAAKQQIQQALARSTHLLAQLSQLAKLDTALGQTEQLQDVVSLAHTDLAKMATFAAAREIKLSLQTPPRLLHPVEKNVFQSILLNLLDNAIRYGRQGGKVEVCLSPQAHGLLLVVADDGPGIAETERENVFERFYRGHKHHSARIRLGVGNCAAG